MKKLLKKTLLPFILFYFINFFLKKKLKVINIIICMNQNTYLLQKKSNTNYSIPNISFKFDKNESNEINNIYEYNQLIYYKNHIDSLEDTKLWDSAKKLSNLYELIYLPNKKYKYDSVSKYEPLSRAYFKLFEILVDFDLINNPKLLKIASKKLKIFLL